MFAERVSYESLLEIANSPTKLKQLMKEAELLTEKYALKYGLRQVLKKRKLNGTNDFTTPSKQRKIMDFFKISPKEIISQEVRPIIQPVKHYSRRMSVSSSASTSSSDNNKFNDLESKSVRLESTKLRSRRSSSSSTSAAEVFDKNVPTKPNATNFNPQKEFEVETIVDIGIERGNALFLVKWKGWSDESNTWEPLSAVSHLNTFDSFVQQKYLEKETLITHVKDEFMKNLKIFNLKPLPDISDKSEMDIIKMVDKINITNIYVDLLLLSLDDKFKFRTNAKIVTRLLKYASLFEHIQKRQVQKEALKDWEDYINSQGNNMNMIVKNEVDYEGPPLNFTYINEYLPGEGVTIPQDPPIGCKCENDCSFTCRKNCCAEMSGGKFAYNSKKRIKILPGMPIYECNKTCKCSPDCLNRVVQNGQKRSLCIFKTSNGRGWGVKTIKPIFKGQYICQYVGEVITAEEAEYRGKTYDAEGRTYLFDLDINATPESSALYTIDAGKYGNISHFINHSCNPNAGVWTVWVNCLDPDIPIIAFFALSDIAPGEEITFDYLNQHFKDDGKLNTELMEAMGCKCESENCRKFLF